MKLINHIPFIQFNNGFHLRKLTILDSEALFPTLNDTENHKFTTFEPHLTIKQTTDWIEKTRVNPIWAIALPDDKAIGFVGYHTVNPDERSCMVAFHLNKEFWGNGIAPAAVILTDQHIFNSTAIVQIKATVKPENVQSQRCLEKAGYSLERVNDDYISSAINDKSRVRYLYSKQVFL